MSVDMNFYAAYKPVLERYLDPQFSNQFLANTKFASRFFPHPLYLAQFVRDLHNGSGSEYYDVI
jgi:hypothetical protein